MKKIILFLILLFLPNLAIAETQRNPCYYTTGNNVNCVSVSVDNPLPTTLGSGSGLGKVQVWDGTNTAVVKPASTPPAATDPAIVTTISPNSAGLVGTSAFGTPNQTTVLSVQNNDPCSYAAKSSKAINITSAATTSLVAVSGATSIYVCGFSLTISEVTTTANTILFEYGTGAACTSPTVLTGLYGGGGVTAAAPIPVTMGNGGGTIFATPASQGLCALTAIGASGSFQGVLTYVQQ